MQSLVEYTPVPDGFISQTYLMSVVMSFQCLRGCQTSKSDSEQQTTQHTLPIYSIFANTNEISNGNLKLSRCRYIGYSQMKTTIALQRVK